MDHDTRSHALPPLVGNVFTDGRHYIDNLLATAWKTLRLDQILLRAGFSKRHGIEVTETVFVLMVWRWLNVSSIAMFCRTALGLEVYALRWGRRGVFQGGEATSWISGRTDEDLPACLKSFTRA